ncbi:Cullin-domain-containing protein [Martensiomyces pterosporus]|nr:Cullin-domain-containing protein [Martensiomyces pterosporus]
MAQAESPPSPNTQEFWEYLKGNLDVIMNESTSGLTYRDYAFMNSSISNCLSGGGQGAGGHDSKDGSSIMSSYFIGMKLFNWITTYMAEHFQGFVLQVRNTEGEDLVRRYCKKWKDYEFASRVVDRIFKPLNDNWITPMRSGRSHNVHPIRTTMYQIWFQRLFLPLYPRLSEAIVALVNKERSGGVVDSMLIEDVYASFISLNPEGTQGIRSNFRRDLGAYTRYYERPYIFSAIRCLVEKTSPYRNEGTTIEYIRQVLQGIEEEELRGERHLHRDSVEPLRNMLNQFLVNSVANPIRQTSREVLRMRNQDALRVIYRFLSRVDDEIGLEPLRKQFQRHVNQYMIEHCPAVPKDVAEGKQLVTPAYTREFVEWLIRSLVEHETMIKDPLGNDLKFMAAFKDAFSKIVSSKELHGMTLDTTPRLLADYCDSLLKSNSEFVNADPETALTDKAKQVLKIYECNGDKDIFAKFYERHLARRLINEQSFSRELETTVSGMIRSITGGDLLTNNTKEMLNDILISQDLTSEFSHWRKDNNQSSTTQGVATGPKTLIPLNAKVLKAGSWPLSAGVKLSNTGDSKAGTINLPLSLASMRNSFDSMYTEKHERRKLHWLWNHSRVELKLFLPHATGAAAKLGYTLILNTYQATILALFTEESGPGEGYDSPQGPTLTCRQIQTATGLDYDTVSAELTVFIKAGIMASNTKTLSERSRICLNPKFQSKRISINLAGIKRSEKKQEITDTVSAAGRHRIALIEAAIIRIMKDRKKLRYPELERLLPGQISRYFPFHICDMKSALENLIDREYIERNENDEKEFTYTA